MVTKLKFFSELKIVRKNKLLPDMELLIPNTIRENPM